VHMPDNDKITATWYGGCVVVKPTVTFASVMAYDAKSGRSTSNGVS